MALSLFKNWPYPDEFSDPFWTAFVGMVGSMDASVFTVQTLNNTIMGGGGTISWASGGGLGWSDDFVVPIFSSGFQVSLRFGPDNTTRTAVLNPGDVLYAVIPVSISTGVVLNLIRSPTVPPVDGAYAVAWRDNNHLRFRDGRVLSF